MMSATAMMIAVMGLPGSGKSYFARKLAAILNAAYIGSDQTRNSLRKRGQYSPEDKLQVYRHMLRQAEGILDSGRAVVLDATFYRRSLRRLFLELGGKLHVPVYFILVEAPEALIRERLSRPREDSEADYKVYKLLKEEFEEPSDPEESCLRIPSGDAAGMLDRAMEYITAQEKAREQKSL